MESRARGRWEDDDIHRAGKDVDPAEFMSSPNLTQPHDPAATGAAPGPLTPILPPSTLLGMTSLPSARRTLLFLLLSGVLVSCGGSTPETIPRATFIEAYVALREAALRAPTGELDMPTRDSLLEARELTPDDLLRFVEVHGRDPVFMGRIWEEIDVEMSERAREASRAAAGVS